MLAKTYSSLAGALDCVSSQRRRNRSTREPGGSYYIVGFFAEPELRSKATANPVRPLELPERLRYLPERFENKVILLASQQRIQPPNVSLLIARLEVPEIVQVRSFRSRDCLVLLCFARLFQRNGVIPREHQRSSTAG